MFEERNHQGDTMPGVVTKKAIVTNLPSLYRLGGIRLIVAMLRAPAGVPFLTVLMEINSRNG
jgi:hypothetical protein